MEKVKELARPWFEPAIIIAIILYVMDIQIDNVRTEIKGVRTELSLFREDVNRAMSRQDAEIKSTDKKIDDLKNSLISRKK